MKSGFNYKREVHTYNMIIALHSVTQQSRSMASLEAVIGRQAWNKHREVEVRLVLFAVAMERA